jgi:hypothetical protein
MGFAKHRYQAHHPDSFNRAIPMAKIGAEIMEEATRPTQQQFVLPLLHCLDNGGGKAATRDLYDAVAVAATVWCMPLAFDMRLKLSLHQRTTFIGIRQFTRAQGRADLVERPDSGQQHIKDYVYRTTFAAFSPRESVVPADEKVPKRLRLSGGQTYKSMIWLLSGFT